MECRVSPTLSFQTGGSVYSRAEVLMNSETGLVGLAWSTLREAWFSEQAPALIVIEYDRFVADPKSMINKLYLELNEPAFRHDFQNMAFDDPTYDATLGMPGLHRIRPKVERQIRVPCIPPDIFTTYADSNFWARPEMNRRGVVLL